VSSRHAPPLESGIVALSTACCSRYRTQSEESNIHAKCSADRPFESWCVKAAWPSRPCSRRNTSTSRTYTPNVVLIAHLSHGASRLHGQVDRAAAATRPRCCSVPRLLAHSPSQFPRRHHPENYQEHRHHCLRSTAEGEAVALLQSKHNTDTATRNIRLEQQSPLLTHQQAAPTRRGSCATNTPSLHHQILVRKQTKVNALSQSSSRTQGLTNDKHHKVPPQRSAQRFAASVADVVVCSQHNITTAHNDARHSIPNTAAAIATHSVSNTTRVAQSQSHSPWTFSDVSVEFTRSAPLNDSQPAAPIWFPDHTQSTAPNRFVTACGGQANDGGDEAIDASEQGIATYN
jgi:hypothetical protein